jgi:membrane fusion protein (multidrug efflux system)
MYSSEPLAPTGWRRFLNLPMAIVVATVLVLVVGAVLIKIGPYIFGGPPPPPPPQTVSSVHPATATWQPQIRAVATLRAAEGADLSAEVAGLVTRVNFTPGQEVKKGALLIQLRDDSDRAQLGVFRAQANIARRTFDRYKALNAENAISKAEYDQAQASLEQANAQVAQQQALVEKKAIRAPYNGRIGIRQVDVGQYVNPGQVLVTLQQVNPILADFLVPQSQMFAVKAGASMTLTSDAVPGRTFNGTVVALDPKVDPATRNVRVRASIPNPSRILLPGMFGEVHVSTGAQRTVLTVPQTSVVYSPYGDTVYLVMDGKDAQGNPNKIAKQKFITLGETRGSQVEIASGVTARDEIVSSGQMKLKNDVPVVVNNSQPLPNDAAPRITDK